MVTCIRGVARLPNELGFASLVPSSMRRSINVGREHFEFHSFRGSYLSVRWYSAVGSGLDSTNTVNGHFEMLNEKKFEEYCKSLV